MGFFRMELVHTLWTALLFSAVLTSNPGAKELQTRTGGVDSSGSAKEEVEFNEWGPWRESDCYKGLDYRVRHKKRTETYDGIKHVWGVQFRNRYQEKIFFSFGVYEGQPEPLKSLYRTGLEPGEVSSGYTDYYLNNDNSIKVFIEKVRFIEDGLQEYSSCDK